MTCICPLSQMPITPLYPFAPALALLILICFFDEFMPYKDLGVLIVFSLL